MNTGAGVLQSSPVAHIKRAIEAIMSVRGDRNDSDIPLDDVDRTTRLIAREAARAAVEVSTYNEGGGGSSWQPWILGIVGGLISVGIAGVIWQLSDIKSQIAGISAKQDASLVATQQRLEADERRIEVLERRVFK